MSRSPATLAICAEIASKRIRQVVVHGYGPEHDDMHGEGQIARAAACYARHAAKDEDARQVDSGFHPWDWPWLDHWRPTDRRDDLVKAAALIVAEIERLDRAAQVQP